MTYSPYIADYKKWQHHFLNPSKERKDFYTIEQPKNLGETMDRVKLVTPTQQAVEQAKSSLKREYDIEQLIARLQKPKPGRKKKKTILRKRHSKKPKGGV